ncbi:MAG: transporter related [Paenibacillaceae bacterium]|jgi:ATP-binding cassette subfamily B protein|nr:transporter related [Paenibacillaceae bacterium]
MLKNVGGYSLAGQTNSLSNNLYMLKLIAEACPSRIWAELLLKTVSYGRTVFFYIIFTRILFNALRNEVSFSEVALLIGIAMAILFLVDYIQTWYACKIRPQTDQTIFEYINLKLFDRAIDVELACFEDPEYYDKHTKATVEANGRALKVLDDVTDLAGTALSSIAILSMMLSLDRIAILFACIPLCTSFFITNLMNKIRYRLYSDNVKDNRVKEYVKRVVYLPQYAKEFRLTGMLDVLLDKFQHSVRQNVVRIKKCGNQLAFLLSLQMSLSQTIMFVGSITYATYRMMVSHTLLIGDYIVLVNSIMMLSNSMVDITKKIIALSENSLYIHNLKSFIQYEPKIPQNQKGLTPAAGDTVLSLNNVSFRYEGMAEPSLQHINIEVRQGEKICIVGHNGSGKTTLVKLILRLYDATEGEVMLNQINIKQYNLKEYRALFGTVLQDFQIFSFSIAENVLMQEASGDEGKALAAHSLRKVGLLDKVERMPQGLNTVLTKEFDDSGMIMSGGEYQKISISRVIAKPCRIVIMDEPSSALDPVAEHELFQMMTKAAEHKTVIFISHRLSSTVSADKIIMMEKGCIAEEGTHQQLMDRDGKYAKMYRMQAENYAGGWTYGQEA